MIVLAPVIIPLGAAALLLTFRGRAQAMAAIAAMGATALAGGALLFAVQETPRTLILGGWPVPIGIALVADPLSTFFLVASQIVFFLGFLYARGAKDACVQRPVFFPLFLTLVAGLNGTFLAGDVFNLFVFTELLVISGAALTALSDDVRGVEASLKYFLLSLLASGFLLLAAGLFYASAGSLNFADLARRANTSPGFVAAMALLVAFFAAKSAVVPFHWWQPDFHTAAPTPVHAVLSSVVVKLGVYGFFRLTTLFPGFADPVRQALLILGPLGALLGGLGAAGTNDLKRMLAYSTLGQIGFLVSAIGWGTPAALAAGLLFAFHHSFIKSGLLMLAGAVASRAPVKGAEFEKLAGVGRAAPGTGPLFLLAGAALAGLPPLNGFWGKFAVFNGGTRAGDGVVLAVLALAALITLVYTARAYLRVWGPPAPANIKPQGDKIWAPAVLTAICLGTGLWAAPVIGLAERTARWILDPQLYIRAVIP